MGGLMVSAALSASWLIEPANSIASTENLPSEADRSLFSLQNGEYTVRVVPGVPEARFELIDDHGILIGQFDSMEAIAQSTGKSSGHLLAELTLEEPIN